MSTARGTSATRATASGFPLSTDSSSANSSRLRSTSSANFHNSRPRSDAVIFRHGPSSKARRAARTARSTSSLSASATVVSTVPVAGLYTGKVLPDAAPTHSSSINSLCGCARKSDAAVLSLLSNATVFTVSSLRVSASARRCGARAPARPHHTVPWTVTEPTRQTRMGLNCRHRDQSDGADGLF